jgi:hypothetical protein
MAPPARRAAQPQQSRRLRRHAVRRHELLLLADRAQEAERMHAEAEHADERHHHQRRGRRQRHAQTLARVRRGEHQERQHQTRGDLHADAHRQRARRCTCSSACSHGDRPPGAGAQRQRQGERRQQQRVVVRATDRQHQQHRVQAHERHRPAARVPELPGGACYQRDRGEARDHGERLVCPQPARQSQRHQRVAEQREQRAVRRVLKWPADEAIGSVARRFSGEVRVRVEPVQRTHAREVQVAKHILGDQRRSQQQDRVCRHDRNREQRRRQLARQHQHQRVAAAHDQHQRLEARARQARAEPAQGPRQPRRPAALARRHVLRWRRRRASAQQKDTRDDPQQRCRAEHSREGRGCARACVFARAPVRRRCDPGGG